ncbi:hypothetical protein CDAR_437611 [Caerostris darwini]|uniref:Uncharacterized protein n=1 Tax=Caerostris darwini TaxID=1538125 RepID=A0AAV4NT12_9ARAC|nr:hypothetical protein CDAR_437611 [Caerostris darwini]
MFFINLAVIETIRNSIADFLPFSFHSLGSVSVRDNISKHKQTRLSEEIHPHASVVLSTFPSDSLLCLITIKNEYITDSERCNFQRSTDHPTVSRD